MTPEQMVRDLEAKTAKLKMYGAFEFPKTAGRKVLRFIQGNFRAQGWQGNSFDKWKPNKRKGTILVKKGKLRRSFRQKTGIGEVRTWSDSPYAAVHNRGFKGVVNVKAHQRRKYSKSKVGTGRYTKTGKERMKTISTQTGTIAVNPYKKKVNIAQRKFMPESYKDSPVLVNTIKRDIEKTLKTIFE